MNDADEPDFDSKTAEIEESTPFNPISRARFLRDEDDFDPIRDIKWVYNALGVAGLRPTDAPSAGAWRMLHEAQQDILVLKAFYSGSFAKLLSTRVQADQETSRVEDAREEFTLIDRLLSEPDNLAPVLSNLEERARELAIQRTYPQSGVREPGLAKGTVGSL